MPGGAISTTMKLKIQFVTVPSAAPLVRMLSELISWDTLQPMPKKNVAEEERDRYFCVRDAGRVRQRRVLVMADHGGDDQVTEALTGNRVHHHLALGPPLHVWDAGE